MMCLREAEAEYPLLNQESLAQRNNDLLQTQPEVMTDTATPRAISGDSYPQHHVRRRVSVTYLHGG